MDDPPITDAHQHFWDLDRVTYPWLRDRPMIGLTWEPDMDADAARHVVTSLLRGRFGQGGRRS